MKEYDKALKDCDEAIRIDPGKAYPYYTRGTVLDEKADYDKAIADYTEAIRLQPKYTDAFTCRGISYLNKQDLGKAFADFNHALELAPDNPHALSNRGNAYYQKGDVDKAIADYTKVIRATADKGKRGEGLPATPPTIFDKSLMVGTLIARGNIYWRKQDYDKALAAVKAAAG